MNSVFDVEALMFSLLFLAFAGCQFKAAVWHVAQKDGLALSAAAVGLSCLAVAGAFAWIGVVGK